jgi:hypothetical protein
MSLYQINLEKLAEKQLDILKNKKNVKKSFINP